MKYPQGSIRRAMIGSPLNRRGPGCIFSVLMIILLGIALIGHLGIWVLEPPPAIGVFLMSFALATVASLFVIWLLWVLDRHERESIWFFVGAVLWGAVISTGLSGVFNNLGYGAITLGMEMVRGGVQNDMLSELMTAAVIAPIVEEGAKGIAVLVLLFLLRAEFDNLRDGIIYGALVGVGFNIAEVALYVMKGYIDTGIAPFGEQFAARFVFLGFNGHMLWSALCGAGIGIARQTANRALRWFAPIGGYLLAAFSHALWNSVGVFLIALILVGMGHELGKEAIPPFSMWVASSVTNLVVEGFAYLVLVFLLYLSAQWERAIIRTYLADEAGSHTVTTEEYAQIAIDRPFGRIMRHTHPDKGRNQAIINAQNELAFRKWHLARDAKNPDNDALVAAWRDDIAKLRAS